MHSNHLSSAIRIFLLILVLLLPISLSADYSTARQKTYYRLKIYKNNTRKATYKNKNVYIKLYEGKYYGNGGKAKFYAAHVKLRNYNKMHIAKANGKYGNGFQTIYHMVHKKNNKAYHAVLAVNCAFNGKDSKKWNAYGTKNYTTKYHSYYEIYGGKYHKGKLGSMYVDNSATYSSKTGYLRKGLEQVGVKNGMTWEQASKKKMISDTFAGDMGFTLLDNGKILGNKNDNSYRQRTFIGTNGKAGDIWIVVCNGVTSGGIKSDRYSKGLNAYGEGYILKKLKCKYGYNLDGGGSTTMIFKGKKVNKQIKLRKCYDALYINR